MGAEQHSAIYQGWVRHRRPGPAGHAFRQRLLMLYLDLDELPSLLRQTRWWALERGRPAVIRRSDYLGDPALPLDVAVRDRVESALGRRPTGPIRLLTHGRHFGLCFNPVSFYYCFTDDGSALSAIVAEITNTPWNERHSYVLDANANDPGRRLHRFRFAKRFHVSPFLPMAQNYDWTFQTPDEDLRVHMTVERPDGQRAFDASLALRRGPADARALDRLVWRQPLMTARVLAGIYWQAARLWLKGHRVHPHPRLADPDRESHS